MARYPRHHNPIAVPNYTQGIEGRVPKGQSCTVFNWEDGTPVLSPTTGQRHYCFNDTKAAEIMFKLTQAEQAAKEAGIHPSATRPVRASSEQSTSRRATGAQASAGAAGDDVVFDCADGRLSLFRGDIYFFPKNGGAPHGIVLEGPKDADRAYVHALREVIRALGHQGQLAGMTGKEILQLNPTAPIAKTRPAAVKIREYKNNPW